MWMVVEDLVSRNSSHIHTLNLPLKDYDQFLETRVEVVVGMTHYNKTEFVLAKGRSN